MPTSLPPPESWWLRTFQQVVNGMRCSIPSAPGKEWGPWESGWNPHHPHAQGPAPGMCGWRDHPHLVETPRLDYA